MALPFYNWSKTSASNATADSTVNWSEGQAPSTVNDSARAMMASTAAFRDDISGTILTGGTASAYTVTSNQVFDSLAHLGGALIAFRVHAPNSGACTLNVDGLGAKPLVITFGRDLPIGALVAFTVYTCTYNSSDQVFYLHNFYDVPYNIPVGGGVDFWGTTVPSSAFAFPIGQAISRTTYSVLFGIMSTTYGVGDGSTTFNLPDKTGRVSAMKEATATRLTTAGSGINGATMGSANGLTETHTLTLAQTPAHDHGGATLGMNTNQSHSHTYSFPGSTALASGGGPTFAGGPATQATSSTNIDHTHNIQSQGSGNAHNNVQPTIICNYIIRII